MKTKNQELQLLENCEKKLESYLQRFLQRFEVEGYVTGFGNPDWARTHEPAVRTAPAVSFVVQGGATCVGKTVMDEMAYSINGENKHYGTPTNPAAPSRIPGGSSSGSAVAVAGELVDFALGWFARDPDILGRVGHILLQLPYMVFRQPRRIIIADDCFQLTKVPSDRTVSVVIKSTEKLFGRQVLNHISLGKYIATKVPSLKPFQSEEECRNGEGGISALKAVSSALRLLQRYEFKMNHEEWINTTKPDLGPGISARVRTALETTDENIRYCLKAKDETREALNTLLKGNAAYKDKQWQKAVNLYSEAIKLNGKNATYYSNRAAAYLELGSFLQAEADCTAAISLDKKILDMHLFWNQPIKLQVLQQTD